MIKYSRACFFVRFVAFASLFAATALADQVVLKGNFVERRAEWGHAYLDGYFFYLYDSVDVENCRLLFEYTELIGGSADPESEPPKVVVSNLYHYLDKAMYSMCTAKCTGLNINERADPWWNVDNLYRRTEVIQDGMYWYERNSVPENNTGQVMKILMREGTTEPSDGYLGAIMFYDGRTVEFQNVVIDNNMNSDDPRFEPRSDCPKATCPIFADIIFVLDSSASVDPQEWRQTVEFVDHVMNSFTFGKYGVQAAVVQFAGRDNGCPDKVKNHPLCPKQNGKDTYRNSYDCKYLKTTEIDTLSTPLAMEDFGNGPTVSSNKTMLFSQLNRTVGDECKYSPRGPGKSDCQAFSGYRGTCQALGLKLAIEMLQRSPRRLSNSHTKPHQIIIAVTDGEDKFPNSTAGNATILKNEYGVLLIEVGVGLQCEYDHQFLRSIASSLGSSDQPAYFNVSDYESIKKIADELFRPLCDSNFSSQCGPECGGFCGCGQCLCPKCDESKNVCHDYKCYVSGGYSPGCYTVNTTYSKKDDVCTWYKCNAEKVDPDSGEVVGEWYEEKELCEGEIEEHPGTCRVIGCNVEYGGCRIELNQTYCRELSKCEEYECTPLGEIPDDAETGCRLVKNFTADCEKELGKRSQCFEMKCDGSSVVCSDMEVDTCTSLNNPCYTFSCEIVNEISGDYGCVPHEIGSHINTSCTTWVCDETDGWKRSVERDEEYCFNYFKEKEGNEFVKCKDFSCNPDAEVSPEEPDGGCFHVSRDGCTSQCTDDQELICKSQVMDSSSVTQCKMNYCVPREQDGNWVLGCKSDEEGGAPFENCLDTSSSSYKKACEWNNANPSECWTPSCDAANGKCTVIKIEIPDEKKGDKCMVPKCNQKDDGSWDWELVPTKLKETCQTDDCYKRECHPTDGCIVTDICVSNTTECDKYTCNSVDGIPVCDHEDLTKKFLKMECLKEICDRKNGKKVTQYSACTNEDHCLEGSCVKGYCVFTPKTPDVIDACLDPICDPKTGEFSYKKFCDDGLYCTHNECWNYGDYYECHNDPIDCAAQISMEGFECFLPTCKEDKANSNYKCQRALLPNAYIDVCGNCIDDTLVDEDNSQGNYGDDDDDDDDGDKDRSYTAKSTETQNKLLTCTNAPAKPLMIESLAAATIALIIIGAVVAGGILTTSTVVGTKTLIDRVKNANDQSAQSNPLYEGAETELMNPTYAGAGN